MIKLGNSETSAGISEQFLSIQHWRTYNSSIFVPVGGMSNQEPAHGDQQEPGGDAFCDVCRALDLTAISSVHPTDIGIFGDILQKVNCPLCRVIVNAIPQAPNWLLSNGISSRLLLTAASRVSGQIDILDESAHSLSAVGSIKLEKHTPGAFIREKSAPLQSQRNLLSLAQFKYKLSLKKSSDKSGRRGMEQAASTSLDVFRRALDACAKDHPICRRTTSATGPSEIPLFLIDLKRNCLVKKSTKSAYVTLSYVWGKVQMIKTCKANLRELRATNSLAKHQSELPNVIKDAMTVATLLGYNFLWIDTLCIVQDDSENKAREISQMNIIYHHASVTLVAVHGTDATTRLRGATGLGLVLQPRHGCEAVKQDFRITPKEPPLTALLKPSHYNSRVCTCFMSDTLAYAFRVGPSKSDSYLGDVYTSRSTRSTSNAKRPSAPRMEYPAIVSIATSIWAS